MEVVCAQCGEEWEYSGGLDDFDIDDSFRSEFIHPFVVGMYCPECKDAPKRRTGEHAQQHMYQVISAIREHERDRWRPIFRPADAVYLTILSVGAMLVFLSPESIEEMDPRPFIGLVIIGLAAWLLSRVFSKDRKKP